MAETRDCKIASIEEKIVAVRQEFLSSPNFCKAQMFESPQRNICVQLQLGLLEMVFPRVVKASSRSDMRLHSSLYSIYLAAQGLQWLHSSEALTLQWRDQHAVCNDLDQLRKFIEATCEDFEGFQLNDFARLSKQ